MNKGYIVYSPIVFTHPIWEAYLLTDAKDPDFYTLKNLYYWKHQSWLDYDRSMMKACDSCLVLMLDGWQESKGIKQEMQFFAEEGRQIQFTTLVDLRNFSNVLKP